MCCGDVYLKGYFNVDIVGKTTTVNKPNPTTVEDYYSGKIVGEPRGAVVDMVMDLNKWSFEPDSVKEFLMICSIEHFTQQEAINLIRNIYNSLKSNGKFRFDFPDIPLTVKNCEDRAMIRMIYGSVRNPHKWGYTPETVRDLLMMQPWLDIEFGGIVKHDYPMIGVTAIK